MNKSNYKFTKKYKLYQRKSNYYLINTVINTVIEINKELYLRLKKGDSIEVSDISKDVIKKLLLYGVLKMEV